MEKRFGDSVTASMGTAQLRLTTANALSSGKLSTTLLAMIAAVTPVKVNLNSGRKGWPWPGFFSSNPS